MVLEGDAGRVLLIVDSRETGVFMENLHMKAGGGRKRIPLYMVDKKHKTAELIASRQRLVGRVALMVHGAQKRAQFTG